MGDPFYIHKRLLLDIAELQNEPYPNIKFHVNDNLTTACLVLTPEDEQVLHLTMTFQAYPIAPPVVTIQSTISHPNIFGSYICASILNTDEGYTPAYTLKSIAIQLLSFFSSDSLEQAHDSTKVDLRKYRGHSWRSSGDYVCKECGFDDRVRLDRTSDRSDTSTPSVTQGSLMEVDAKASTTQCRSQGKEIRKNPSLLALPDEILLLIFAELSTKDLWSLGSVLPATRDLLNSYDFIRVRELQCFCLKENFLNVKLGVGVHISHKAMEGIFESEFDLLSHRGFYFHRVRKSIQGLYFEHWLPLPLSRRHWRTVRPDLDSALDELARCANLRETTQFDVISRFMNDVVVKFNQEAERSRWGVQGTLSHASEKAVESYFALYHLLLCLAVEQPKIVQKANESIERFLNGRKSKAQCPNLGLLLVAALISDHELTVELIVGIIKEAALRNVVWMLDAKGGNKPELSYLEPSAVSDYRLHHSYQASRTSYRLLMFLNLFFRTARTPGRSLAQLRDDMFDAHGAPPRGMAEHMAREIRRIKDISAFPPFLKEMGLKPPHKADFSTFLKRMIVESREAGYSAMPLSQLQAYSLRRAQEPGVAVASGMGGPLQVPNMRRVSFFPRGNGRSGRDRNLRGRRR